MEDRSKAYSRQKHRLAIISLFSQPLILFILIFSGASLYIKRFAMSVSFNIYVSLPVFLVIMAFICYLAGLPLLYYSDHILERKYGLSNQDIFSWIRRETKKLLLFFVIGLPIAAMAYIFIKYYPAQWWILTAMLLFLVSFILAKFMPLLIVPLFYKYSPIKDPALKESILSLAKKTGVSAEGVYEIDISRDTKKANAAVMGMGKQKRIVLCDTLIRNFTKEEIDIVMGHELGHHKKHHNLMLVLFEAISTLAVLFAANIIFLRSHGLFWEGKPLHDFESLVLIYAIISALSVLISPILNAFSRKLERDADRFALDITKDKNAFISTMKKLAAQNLADQAPGHFYEIVLYSHPSISRRISFAESYGTKK